jgi:pimeloyl-ACP methyl ester carboxylesterase
MSNSGKMSRTGILSKQSFYVEAGGHRLAVERFNPNGQTFNGGLPTIVFLHEGLGSIGQWRDFPAALCLMIGLPGLAYDRWGYGKSDPVTLPRPVRYLHEEALTTLPEVLEKCEVGEAILVGHSDGGSMALMFASIYPKQILGIVTEAAHVFVEDVTVKGIEEAVQIYRTTDLPERLSKYHGANTDLMFRGWAETWLSPEFRSWNVEEYLPGVTCPVLAIQGVDDQYGTPAQVESITGKVSGPARKLLIPACGHIPHHEARAVVLSEINRFVVDILTHRQKNKK